LGLGLGTFWGGKYILISFGQKPETAILACKYFVKMLPSLCMASFFDLNRIFLAIFEYTYAPIAAVIVMIVLHTLFLTIFVSALGFGLTGCAYASLITQFMLMLMLYKYTTKIKGDIENSWFLMTTGAFNEWWQYLEHGLPCVMMVVFQLFLVQMMQTLANGMSNLHSEVMAILCRIFVIGLILMKGVNLALCRGIGKALGKQDPNTARRYNSFGLVISVVCTVIMWLILSALRTYLCYLMTQDD
jgi:Na+-driven multidrug efflux pump